MTILRQSRDLSFDILIRQVYRIYRINPTQDITQYPPDEILINSMLSTKMPYISAMFDFIAYIVNNEAFDYLEATNKEFKENREILRKSVKKMATLIHSDKQRSYNLSPGFVGNLNERNSFFINIRRGDPINGGRRSRKMKKNKKNKTKSSKYKKNKTIRKRTRRSSR